MITRTLLILFGLMLVTFGSLAQTEGRSAVTMKEFTENPWPFAAEINEFDTHYGQFLKKEKYAMRSRYESSKRDTIIRFFKGKNEIFFFKPYNGKAYFVAANIFDSRIAIRGNIAPGMDVSEFYRRVAYPQADSDTIRISLPDGAFHTSLIIRSQKIHHIKIEARNKKK